MNATRRHITDIIFLLSLLCVFAVTAVFVVIFGADVYKGISQRMQDNGNMRSSITYLSEKVRQNDSGGVRLGAVGQSDALILDRTEDGRDYCTWIYAADGWLYEAVVPAAGVVAPGDGQKVTQLALFELDVLDSGLIEITAAGADGEAVTSAVRPRCGTPEVDGA